jgi:hypothetical protein
VQEDLLELFGLTPHQIAAAVTEAVNGGKAKRDPVFAEMMRA